MATIKEIAKACNVSITTVSNILHNKPGASEATRQLVFDMIKKMDYHPNTVAQNLKLKYTKTVGIVLEDMTVFNMPEIVDGITEYCEKENYQILLTNLRLYKKYEDVYYHNNEYFDSVAEEIKKLVAKRVDGIIYVPAHERMIHCIPRDLEVPTVVAYGYTGTEEIPSVVVDDAHGAYEIMSYVASQGHRKIGIIAGKEESMHTQSRLKGCQKAFYDHGILYNPELVRYGQWNRRSGYRETETLLLEGVTAIFCMSDIIAGGVYDYLHEKGMKPGEDISVAGYDNRNVSEYYNPSLTTINLPLHDIGYQAGEAILKRIRGEETNAVYSMACQLVERKSVKKI